MLIISRGECSSDDEDVDEDKNRGKVKSKPTEALTLSEFWSSTRPKESRKLASNSNGHDNEEHHHQHTQHNYRIMSEFKGQMFPLLLEQIISKSSTETTLSPDNATLFLIRI